MECQPEAHRARLTPVCPVRGGERRSPRGGQQRAVFTAPPPSSRCREVHGPGENRAQRLLTQEVGRRLDTELCRHRHIGRAFAKVSGLLSAEARPPDAEPVGLFLRQSD